MVPAAMCRPSEGFWTETPEPPRNTVYIGKKPLMDYILAVVARLHAAAGEVVIKARGRSISRAVDIAEIVRNRYVTDAKVRDVRIATEKLEGEGGKVANVSSIEIVLARDLPPAG